MGDADSIPETLAERSPRLSDCSRSSKVTSRSLTLPMSKELIRAVPLSTLLKKMGQHLQPPENGMINVDQKLYSLSRGVETIQDFVSHDWGTPRWLKLLALCVHFNAVAASCASLVISIFCGVLFGLTGLGSESLSMHVFSSSIGFVTFWFFLFFWQQMKDLVGHPRMVFFDKLCIAQHDEELKRQGILGLSTFLEHSKSLTVLWSRRYFTRLWCTYEICSFLRHEKDKEVVIMPVTLALLFCVLIISNQLVAILNMLIDRSQDFTVGMQIASRAALVLPAYTVMIYFGIGLVRDLRALTGQLKCFNAELAECFCCSCHHVHPKTGEAIPCDRELVTQTLDLWFGSTCTFETLVRERLMRKVQRSLALITSLYPLEVAIASTFPLLIWQIPQLFHAHALKAFATWCTIPLMTLVSTWLIQAVCVAFSCIPRRWRCFASFLLACVLLSMMSLLWLPIALIDRHTGDLGGLILLPMVMLIWLLRATFSRPRATPVHGHALPEAENDDTFSL